MSVQTKRHNWERKYEIITDENGFPEARCYACSVCNKCVARKDVFKQNGLSYCWECFGEVFSRKCGFCKKRIRGSNEVTFVYYNGMVWHEECFSQSGTIS